MLMDEGHARMLRIETKIANYLYSLSSQPQISETNHYRNS